MEKTLHDVVLDFIEQFRELGATNCFSNGMCYYFSIILKERFGPFVSLMYAEVDNHFGTRIADRIYDITGDVTDKYDWTLWSRMLIKDPLLYERILRDCIAKERGNDND